MIQWTLMLEARARHGPVLSTCILQGRIDSRWSPPAAYTVLLYANSKDTRFPYTYRTFVLTNYSISTGEYFLPIRSESKDYETRERAIRWGQGAYGALLLGVFHYEHRSRIW